jgi:hypothetical protein
LVEQEVKQNKLLSKEERPEPEAEAGLLALLALLEVTEDMLELDAELGTELVTELVTELETELTEDLETELDTELVTELATLELEFDEVGGAVAAAVVTLLSEGPPLHPAASVAVAKIDNNCCCFIGTATFKFLWANSQGPCGYPQLSRNGNLCKSGRQVLAQKLLRQISIAEILRSSSLENRDHRSVR